ncbi:MAG TPA: hypothetical protein VN522_05100 [Solirubrobacterales bacterium]|nr:hypothetical protein [Solirubrobacterales bacterium]
MIGRALHLGTVATLVTLVSALCASSAAAATTITTKPVSWKDEFGVEWAAAKASRCSVTENLKIKGTILAQEVELDVPLMECTGTLSNEVVGGQKMAVGSVTLEMLSITVVKPAACLVNGAEKGHGEIVSNPIKLIVDMHEVGGVETPIPVVKFESTVASLFKLKLTNCAIEGIYPVAGFFIGEGSKETAAISKSEGLNFNATTNAAGALTMGGNAATITGKSRLETEPQQEFKLN